MMNRNLYQNPQSRNSSRQKHQQSSFEVSNSQNYSFFSEEFNSNNLPSPINKVDFQFGHDASQEDILNFSSNHRIQEQMTSRNASRGQSPANFQNKKNNFFASKKFSVPEGMMFNDAGPKIEWGNKISKQSSQEYSLGLRRLNGARNSFVKQENKEDTEYSSQVSKNRPDQYFSQKLIQTGSTKQEKYNDLARSYQQLQKEYQKIKQQNIKLKNSREELMNENIRTKKQASYQIDNLSKQIQSLKQQIYRLEMDRQSSMTNRTFTNTNMSQSNNRGCYTRDLSFYSARGNNQMGNVTPNGEVNLFYVEQLQRQNDQLVKENRRLNDIIMKKLKHSIVDA